MPWRSLYLRVPVFGLIFALTLAWFWDRQADVAAVNERRLKRVMRSLGERPVVFFGDSHIECGVDDAQDKRILNLATSSEHYVFTLQKLRRFRPRVAVVGAWIHSFLPYYQGLVGKVFVNRFDIWLPTMTPSELGDVMRECDFESVSFSRTRLLLPFLGTKLETRIALKRRGLGGFLGRGYGSAVEDTDARRRRSEMFATEGETPSAFQIRYLGEIVDHCRREGVEVVLLSTPVHERLLKMQPPFAVDAYRSALQSLTRVPGVRHWDYESEPFEDALFRDPDHLNLPGAWRFTHTLLDRLEAEGLLGGP